MKTPDDTHIPEKNCRYADCELPINAVLYGFVVDSDGEKLNAKIKEKLQLLDVQSPKEIVLEGVIQHPEDTKNRLRLDKRMESPFSSFVSAFEKKIDLILRRLQRMLELQDGSLQGQSLLIREYS